MQKLNLRNVDCPLALVQAKRHLQQYQDAIIQLTNLASAKDIKRYAEQQGWHCQLKTRGKVIEILIQGNNK